MAPHWLHILPEVAEALRDGRPVVALESALITHGLPRPTNLEIAQEMDREARRAGAVPAVAAVIEGRPHLGLSPAGLQRLAEARDAHKLNVRDLAVAAARGANGGTTVSATLFVARAAQVRVFATGGIGGVHRGDAGDVSADLPELARSPVAVVCAGPKSILDLPRTLEWLETAGVPVLVWGADEFPGFFTRSTGVPAPLRVDGAAEIAEIARRHWEYGHTSGLLVCVPCPEPEALPPEAVQAAIDRAMRDADAAEVSGKDLTPFLLARLAQDTGGATLRANLALLKHNARRAGELAAALSLTPAQTG